MKRIPFLETLLILVVIAVLGIFLSETPKVQAEAGDENRIFVDANGPFGGNGSREQPYRDLHSLTEALRSPTNTKTEVWITGTFTEALMLDPEMSGTPEQSLLIKQWDGQLQALIDTSSQPNASAISYNGASYITFDGLHATSSGSDVGSLPIFVNNSTGAIVRNGRFYGGGESGTCLSMSTNVLIEGNIFEWNEGNGILVPGVQGAIIRNNIIRNNALDAFAGGIFISSSSDIVIEGNTIADNGNSGIFAPGASNLTVERNDITGNGKHGLEIGSVSGEGKILYNRIAGNSLNGLALESREAATLKVAGNIFAGNLGGGTYLKMSPETVTLTLVNNTFLSNGPYAIDLNQWMATVNVFNNIIMGHEVGAQLISNRTDRVQSDFNDVFDNVIAIQFAQNAQQPWKGWGDWKALGNDQNSLWKNPKFTTEPTCIADGICVSYHLSSDSPLVDQGKRIGRELEEDIDGQSRTYNRIDIGADEVVPDVN